jgi:hypothetical protein
VSEYSWLATAIPASFVVGGRAALLSVIQFLPSRGVLRVRVLVKALTSLRRLVLPGWWLRRPVVARPRR